MGIIQIKTNRGLNYLVGSNGEPIAPKLYRQKEKNRNGDGIFVSDYTEKPLPGSKKYLAPKWDTIRKIWPWGADEATFQQVVEDLALRYPAGHPRQGEVIRAGKLSVHQKNFRDPIFHHPDLIGKVYIEGGTGALNLDIPLEKFLYYNNREVREVFDETAEDGRKVNPLMKNDASIVFSSAEKGVIKKRRATTTYLDAMQVIIKNQHDIQRLQAFTTLFSIPGVSTTSGINELVNALTAYVRDYGEQSQRGSSYPSLNDALIAHDKMDDTELRHRYIIKVAKNKGHIRSKSNGFILLGTIHVDGPTSISDMYTYFSSANETATEQFMRLLEKMNELKEI